MSDPNTYERPKDGWVCFFCGERFTTSGMAREHFGNDPLAIPGCQIKLGHERNLLGKIRDLEAQASALLSVQSAERAASLVREREAAERMREEAACVAGANIFRYFIVRLADVRLRAVAAWR